MNSSDVIQVKYIFPSYTTINIHTIKCYKLLATCFGRPCDHHQTNIFTDRVPSIRVQYGNPQCVQIRSLPKIQKFSRVRIKVCVCVVGRIVCTVPILDSPAVEPSADDAARQINNKTSCVIKKCLSKQMQHDMPCKYSI